MYRHAEDDSIQVPELDFQSWLQEMRQNWKQGEHVVIIGPTGMGKTTCARYLLAIRQYVVALAVKHHDDTIETFKKPWHESGNSRIIIDPAYTLIKSWPPEYHLRKIVYWVKPKELRQDPKQADKIYRALNDVFRAGGWALFLDDLGYIAGSLRLKSPVATMFSQGRSNNNSIVAAVTQPTSVAQQVPTETFRQVRYILMFHFDNRKDVLKVGEMAGVDPYVILQLNDELSVSNHDFLCIRSGQATVVRGEKGK